MKRTIRFTEIYYDDAERLAMYLSERDHCEVVMETVSSEFFPLPPKMKDMPDSVNVLAVSNYEIAFLERRVTPEKDIKYRNRTLHRVMLGDRLRETRESMGLTYEDLERLTGIKARNIENIENGRFDATIDILGNLADAMDQEVGFVSLNIKKR